MAAGQPAKNQYRRDSVDLGKATREWRALPASLLRIGDTIPDVGLILSLDFEKQMDPEQFRIKVKSSETERHYVWDRWSRPEPSVFAFVEVGRG